MFVYRDIFIYLPKYPYANFDHIHSIHTYMNKQVLLVFLCAYYLPEEWTLFCYVKVTFSVF